ncbi:MAG: MFS transporter [Elusimicrobia bacterium]|nr:MFS transporter [Elusimicrobiota bacterium]
MFSALKHRNFRLFFFGQFVSLVGSWMQNTAQAWLVYRLTGDPMMLGLVAFVGQFPVFVLGFYAGFAVDHADHLKLVKRTQFLAMVQAALLALLTWGGGITVWQVFALSLGLGVVYAFDMPARQVLIGELVPPEQRHQAIALNSTVVNASRIVGPALAGLAIAYVGEAGCFALNALSYVAVLISLRAMRAVHQPPPHEARGGPWREIGEGLAYAFGSEPIRLVLLALAVFSLTGLPVYTLLPVFAEGVLRSGVKGFGVLSSFSGLGAMIGALDLARRRGAAGVGVEILSGAAGMAAALAGMAWSRNFTLSCFLMTLAGWCAIRVLAGANTALQELSDDRHRGRVMGFYSMIFIGLSPLGSFLAGGLASRFGVAWTTAGMAVCMGALAVGYGRRLRLI